MPANGKPNGRFELPLLTPVHYSLTDGTDIPPPPESPIIGEKAPTPPSNPEPSNASAATENGHSSAPTAANGVYDGRGRTSQADVPPLSPASSARQSSIRRFLSRKSLNANYTNGTDFNNSQENLSAGGMPPRPESSLSFSRPSMKKKSGSWFKRLTGSGGVDRTSMIIEERENPLPKGPPPPKLPELSQLKSKVDADDGGSLGGEDMFKNIK